jgi:hypothetical protein
MNLINAEFWQAYEPAHLTPPFIEEERLPRAGTLNFNADF